MIKRHPGYHHSRFDGRVTSNKEEVLSLILSINKDI